MTSASSSSSSTLLCNLVAAGTKEQKALVQLLASLSPPITTADELLSSKSRILSGKLRMNSPKELDNLKTFISTELCAMFSSSSSVFCRSQGWRGFTSLSDLTLISNINKLSSGFVDLDALLPGNGFDAGQIYEVLGPAASGKSQICMSILARAAVTAADETKLLYIDTSGSVTYGRMCDMVVHSFNALYERSATSLEISTILSRIHVARITDPWRCLNIISAFKHESCADSSTGSSDNCNSSNVIIIDSIHDLFSPYITDEIRNDSRASVKLKSSSESKLPSVSVEPILAQIFLLLRSLAFTTAFISNLTYQNLDERVISDNSVVWTDCIDGSLLLWRHAATTSYATVRFMRTRDYGVGDHCDYKTTRDEDKMESGRANISVRECLIDFKL